VAGDVPTRARRREDPPQQCLVGLEDEPTRAQLQLLDRSGGTEPVAGEEDRLGPVLDVVLDPVDDALRVDAGRVIRETHRLGHHGVEPLAAEVRRAELVELVVESGRVHQLNLPDPVRPQCRRSCRAAGNGRDVEAL
jgi:hypothetical protein